MLDFQTQQFAFRFGLAEGVDPHQVPPGTLMTAENVAWSKSGRIEKRAGTTAFSRSIAGGGTLSAAARLAVRDDELCAIDGTNLYSWSTVASAWENHGAISEVGLTWSTLLTTEGGVKASDFAITSDGRIVHAWFSGDPSDPVFYSSGSIFYQVFDRATGARSVQATELIQVSNCSYMRVVASGTNFAIIWDEGQNIRCSINGGAQSTLRSDAVVRVATIPLAWDACVIASTFVIAYEKAPVANVGAIKLYSYNFADPPVQQATGAVTGETCNGGGTQSFTCLGLGGASGESLYLGYAGKSSANTAKNRVYFAAYNPSTLAETQGRTLIDSTDDGTIDYLSIGIARATSTTCAFAYEATLGTVHANSGVDSWIITNAGVASAHRVSLGVSLVSKPFALGSTMYMFVADHGQTPSGGNKSQQQNTYLVEVGTTTYASDPHRYVGMSELLLGSFWIRGFLSAPLSASSTETLACTPYLIVPNANGSPTFVGPAMNGARSVSATIGASLPADMWRSLPNEHDVAIVAGALQTYDGQRPFDYGFANGINLDSSTVGVAGGGGAVAAGTYLASLVPEWRSATGMLYRGPTLPPWSIIQPGAGVGHLTIKYVPIVLSPKRPLPMSASAVFAATYAYYRTTVGGAILYRETVDPRLNVITPSYITSPGTFTDTSSDANVGNSTSLSTKPVLYTTGGELDDFQPPAFITMTKYRTRFFGIGGDKRTLWLSKDYSANVGTAPAFHPSLTIAGWPEDLTALAVLDDKLVVFSKTSIWFIAGDGPAPNGQSSDYGTPIRVQTDVGCTSARSVVSTPDGVMFLSARGLYLLTRGLEVVWLGRAVVDELATYPNVTSAVLYARRNEVRFTANNSGGTAGIALVYNYVEKQWSTAKYTVNAVYGAPIADACLWQDLWTFVTPDGFVVQESTSSYLDGSAWVPLLIETAWIGATGPLTFKAMRSFQLEGFSTTNHDLTISVGFDSDTSYPETVTFLAGSPVTAIGPLEQCEITIGTRRKCQHIRFKIQDATPTSPGTYPVGSGKGPSFDTMGLEIGLKKGFAVNPATKKG